jgi:hypothetical protein
MKYVVTYLLGGEQRVNRLRAPDAASAVSAVRTNRGHSAAVFELISVVLIEDLALPRTTAAAETSRTKT